MKLVIKYGGTSLANTSGIRNASKFISSLGKKNSIVVVCSAIDGVTDELFEISKLIECGKKKQVEEILFRMIRKHKQLGSSLLTNAKLKSNFSEVLTKVTSELEELVHGLILLGEITPRSLDYLISFGERLSIILVSHTLQEFQIKSSSLTGKEAGIITDSNHGESRPLMDTTKIRVSKNIDSLLVKKIIPVIGGFAGADQYGNTTTFGRGGSDYTATIIAACINADEIWLMSDVDGLMTADPKLVKNSKLLKEVSYAEAIEMAQFGAKQIHPRTFEPILAKKIPMRIRSSFAWNNNGTLVTPIPSSATKKTVKCVAAIRKIGLIDISGGILFAAPGSAAKIFATLAEENVNIMMVSSNPSESSISLIVKKTDLDKAVNCLEMNLLGKMIKKIEPTYNLSIIAVIGSGMKGTAGIASKVFNAASKKRVNVIMIAQGSSELNLAFVVKDSDSKLIVQALHDEFQLSKIN